MKASTTFSPTLLASLMATGALTMAALSFSAPATALTQPVVSASKPHLQTDDIFNLEFANDVQISPNGRYIAYVRNSYDVMTDGTARSIWLVDTKTGAQTPLFDDGKSYGNLAWSKDSSRLAFTSNRSGSNEIHVHWLAEQRTATLSNLAASPRGLSWSHDGQHIAFLMNEDAPKTDYAKSVKTPSKPKGANWAASPIVVERTYYQRDGQGVMPSSYTQLFVIPATGGSGVKVTEGPYDHGGPIAWTPDNKGLIFNANRNAEWEYQTNESDLWQVTLADGTLTQLTDLPGSEYAPSMSPDGDYVAFLHRGNDKVPYLNSTLHVLEWDTDPADIERRDVLTSLDRSLESPQWLSDDEIAVQYNDRGRVKVAKVSLSGRLTDLTEDLGGVYTSRPYVSGMFSAAAEAEVIAYTHGTEYRLADVATVAGSKQRTYTQLNEDVLGQRQLGKVNEITYNSSFDDTKIQGWYITPPDYEEGKRYPLIVEIHGGPHLAYGPHFAAEHQRYAAEGYVVLYVNYRGSTGYGEEFANLLDGFYSSERDFADHMSGVDTLIERGIADPNNLYIAGGSAGGIATAYAVGLTDRFNAAAATNPVINWVSKVLTADSSIGQIGNQFPGMPWEELEHYWQRSPLSIVGNVKTPTLLFTGEKDRRTPISETEQFYQALQLQKVPTVMVRVPDAYHGVTARPSRIVAKVEHTLAWFAQYKK